MIALLIVTVGLQVAPKALTCAPTPCGASSVTLRRAMDVFAGQPENAARNAEPPPCPSLKHPVFAMLRASPQAWSPTSLNDLAKTPSTVPFGTSKPLYGV